MAKEPREPNEKKGISRRDFLKGVAAGAISVSTVGLLGACTSNDNPPVSDATATPAPIDAPNSGIEWAYEADVVVLGLGGAGACAAIEAHDAGSSVIIIEKQEEATHFTNTRMSGGVFHNPDPTGDKAAMVEYVKAMMSGENIPGKMEGEQEHVSQAMAEMYAQKVLEVEPFLLAQAPDLDPEGMAAGGDASFPMFPGFAEAKYGATVSCRYKGFADADSSLAPYEQPMINKNRGEAFHWALVEQGVKEKRPAIQVMYSTPAKNFIKNEAGEIIGVVAEQNGAPINVKAKRGVVLATGGFEYNLPMRKAFLKGPGVKGWGFYGSPHNTGDGIEMAIKAGAALAKVMKSASRIEVAVPWGENYETKGLKMGVNTSVTSSKNSVVVDNYGKRYADEHIITDSTRPYRYQFYEEACKYDMLTMNYPRIPSWSIFDETRRTSGPVVSKSFSTVAYGYVPWEDDNSDAIERGWILKADTLEELAEKIKADPENREMIDTQALVDTVNKFNEYCEAGSDPEFNRTPATMGPVVTPPFYAIKLYPGGPNTKGGIDADAQRRTLDWNGEPIPRLYTAGEISSVFKFTYQAGGNLTECIVCGREAGKNVADLEPWA